MNLTPMVDVVFHLLIFFMLTTSFIRMESMEMSFPSQAEVQKASSSVLRILISGKNHVEMNNKPVSEAEMKNTVKQVLAKNADQSILLLSGEDVNVQRLVSVMDTIYLMGGKNVAVADWQTNKQAKQVPAEAEKAAGTNAKGEAPHA